MSDSPVSSTPNRRASSPECPPAPRRLSRQRSASDAAYDAAIRALAGDLQARLDQSVFLADPPVNFSSPVMVAASAVGVVPDIDLGEAGLTEPMELDTETPPLPPLPEPSPVLERQRALGTASPTLFIVGAAAAAAAAAVAMDISPIVTRRETDIETDVNMSESEEETETEAEVETDTEMVGSESEETNTGPDSSQSSPPSVSSVASVSAVSAAVETTGGLHLSVHRQGHTGHLALGIEAPMWMWVFLAGMVTSYMWLIVAFLVRGGA